MPVVTTSVASQNGGLATVLVGSIAPTVPDLAINVQQLRIVIVVRLDPAPPPFSSPVSRSKDRTVCSRGHRLLPRLCPLPPLVRERCSIP